MRWRPFFPAFAAILAGISIFATAPLFAAEPARNPAPAHKLDLALSADAAAKIVAEANPCHVQFGSIPKVPGYLVSSVVDVDKKLISENEWEKDDLPHEAKRLKEKVQQLSDTFRWNIAHGQVSLEHQGRDGGTVSGIYYGHHTIMIRAKRKF